LSEENKQNETENGATENEQEELGQIASQALRGPKFGVFEQLICQHLVQATVTSHSLLKIHFITDAALMLDAEKVKSLDIDTEKLEVVKAVCDALRNKTVTQKGELHQFSVKFGFEHTEENYNKFIMPFWGKAERSDLYHFPHFIHEGFGTRVIRFHCPNCHSVVGDSLQGKTGYNGDYCVFCGQNLTPQYTPVNARPGPYTTIAHRKGSDVPYWYYFFEVCRVLSRVGYSQLLNAFLKWAMPYTMELMRKLTQAVRPEIYNQIAAMFISAKKDIEK